MKIELQPFCHDDFDRLIQWVPTAEFMILWSGPFFTFPLDGAQLEAYLKSAQIQPPVRKPFKAVDCDTGFVIGHIELNNIDYRNMAATLSKVLVGNPDYRGKGIGKQMVRQLMCIAFDELHLHRIDLRTFDFNTSAINCYKKVGFQIEGHLRDFRKVDDEYWSSYLMSILEDDWRKGNLFTQST
jgi:RimJ/RimL family protein N-acetyltransferase